MKERFDVIVVGAGPAGLAAAYTTAKAGLKTIIFERGEFPGSKNMFGGVLFAHSLSEMFPDFWEEAPLERALVEERYWLLSEDSATTFSFKTKSFGQPPYNGFSVLRAKFDRWFAEKAVEAGALLVNETLVEKLIQKDGKTIGVQTGREDGDVYGDVVIVAEGVNSLLTKELGIHEEWRGNEVGVGVKELISLPKETIQERFNLEGNEGIAMRILGTTRGMTGGAFLYTNKASVSIGVACMVEDVSNECVCPNDLIDDLKNHPMVKPLIAGGSTKEYSAHMIPEAGFRSIPELVHDGLMIVGDAAMLTILITGEGANLAVTSGRLAGEAAVKAKENGDFSANGLSSYKEAMDESYVIKDLKQFKDFAGYFHSNRDILNLYPSLLNGIVKQVIATDGLPRSEKIERAKAMLKEKKSYWQLMKEAWHGWRSIR